MANDNFPGGPETSTVPNLSKSEKTPPRTLTGGMISLGTDNPFGSNPE